MAMDTDTAKDTVTVTVMATVTATDMVRDDMATDIDLRSMRFQHQFMGMVTHPSVVRPGLPMVTVSILVIDTLSQELVSRHQDSASTSDNAVDRRTLVIRKRESGEVKSLKK